jgi:hypothetical protein
LPGNKQLHSLRGLGGGSSSGVPQLDIQALISFQGTPSRERLKSAKRRASSARMVGLISGMTTMAALLTSAIGALHATPLPSEGAFVYYSLVRDPTE